MKSFIAFLKKEIFECIRSGKLTFFCILFLIFGIMNPAIAKLTPWMLETLSDSLAEQGMMVTEVTVNALTSWTQFFKNIPIVLIVFVFLYSGIFTKEYETNTLILILTKGLSRYKVVFAKFFVMFTMWTIGYLLCFAVTYGYNAFFWDNSIAVGLLPAMVHWWLFGVWIIGLIVLFSVLFGDVIHSVYFVIYFFLCESKLVLRHYARSNISSSKSILPQALELHNLMQKPVMMFHNYFLQTK